MKLFDMKDDPEAQKSKLTSKRFMSLFASEAKLMYCILVQNSWTSVQKKQRLLV